MPPSPAPRLRPTPAHRLLAPQSDVPDDKDPVQVGAQAILEAIDDKRAPKGPHEVLEILANAWHEQKLAIPQDAECFTYEVRQDAVFRKAAKKFGAFTV